MNTTQYELSLSDNMILSENNKHVSLKIYQIQAESFYMLTQKQNHKIFAIIMKDIEKALKLKLYTDSQSFVSEEYHDLIDVFKRQHVNKSLSHQKKYDIEIELKSEKISNFRFLYSMS